jgi:ketosteroid isomerase-like protein
MKTTKDVVLEYFEAFAKNNGWENLLTEDITFNSPTGEVKGKDAFVQMTNQFKQGVVSASVKSIITEGDNASALTNYQMAIPAGDKLDLVVSEIIKVKGQKIKSFEIYFDTAKLNAFMAKASNN